MSLTRIGSIGINTGIAFAGVTTIVTLNTANDALSIGATVNVGSGITLGASGDIFATGVSTFSGNLKVGSGVTISPDGDGFFTGVITATSYSGIDLSDVTGATGDFSIADKIVHTGDTNTAIRFPAADTFTVETGGSERIRVDSSGNMGVGGNNSPTSSFVSARDLVIGTASGSNGMTIMSGTSNSGHIEFSDGTGSDATKTAGGIRYYHDEDYMRFNTGGGTERLRIDSSGRIGVGVVPTAQFAHNLIQIGNQATLGANAALSTTGQTFLTHNLYFDTGGTYQVFNTSSANEGAIISLVDGTFKFSNSAATTGTPTVTERFRIDSSGRLLLGTTDTHGSDADDLVIATSGTTGITVRSGTSGSGNIYFADGNSGTDLYRGRISYNHADDSLFLGTANANDGLKILSNGDFGLGTTSPAYTNALFGGAQRTLHVSGTAAPIVRIQSSTSGQADLILQAGNSAADAFIANAASNGDLVFSTNNGSSQGTRLRILDDGGLCFNSDTAAANALDDYEEGQWTPSANNFTIATQYSANYTKIGDVVFVQMYIQAAAGSGTGAVQVSGLPYTVRGSQYYSYAACRIGGTNAQHNMVFQFNASSTNVTPYVYEGNINEGMISGQHLIMSGFYHV